MKRQLHIEELESRAAPAGMPLGIGGTNVVELPLIGAISVGSALRAPADTASEHVDFAGMTSNPFPFVVR